MRFSISSSLFLATLAAANSPQQKPDCRAVSPIVNALRNSYGSTEYCSKLLKAKTVTATLTESDTVTVTTVFTENVTAGTSTITEVTEEVSTETTTTTLCENQPRRRNLGPRKNYPTTTKCTKSKKTSSTKPYAQQTGSSYPSYKASPYGTSKTCSSTKTGYANPTKNPSPTRSAHPSNSQYPGGVKCSKAPEGVKHYPCDKIEKACSCLSIPKPKVTVTVTSTLTATEAVKTTVTITEGEEATVTVTETTVSTATEVVTETPPSFCSNTCVNLQTDPNNCGKCGVTCSSGVCANGVCTVPSCERASCGTFQACGPGGDCICAATSESTGFCVPGTTQCAGLPPCTTTADCGEGTVCAVDTCCGSGVCAPVQNFCVNEGLPERLFKRKMRFEGEAGRTIGGW